MVTPVTLAAALQGRSDRAGPLVTFYDDATGDRAELSAATLENAVAKTANLLVDVLDVQPGERVAIDLPLHWQLPVWLGACWAVGAVAVVGGPGDVAVVGPDAVTRATGARDVVAVSLLPFGMPFREPLPPGVLDHAVEARAQGDRFAAAITPAPHDPALEVGGEAVDQAGVLDRAAALADRLGLPRGGRVLTTAPPDTTDAVLAVLAVPLAVDGSVVLVRHADATLLPDRARQERADARLVSG